MNLTYAEIQALLALVEAIEEMFAAPQRDRENGAAWLNEIAAAKWEKENSSLLAAMYVLSEKTDAVSEMFKLEASK
tara:strand:+ start:206 stop:433 length:228 start_codon:yes stop_codon:yes gene_type:complete